MFLIIILIRIDLVEKLGNQLSPNARKSFRGCNIKIYKIIYDFKKMEMTLPIVSPYLVGDLLFI